MRTQRELTDRTSGEVKENQVMKAKKGNRMGRRIVLAMSAAALLLFGGASAAQAQVPGNDGLLVFHSKRDGENEQIYTATRTGQTITRLTDNSAKDTDPAWSPDGTKIAFVSDRDGGDREIYVMNADGSDQTRITDHVGDDMDPAWSPDGSRIAIRRNVSGNNEIFLIDAADGGNPVNLTKHEASDFEPEFSPDGSKIAFQRYTSGSGVGFGNEVFLMNADGSGQVNLTDNVNSINDGRPSFSPDGSRIAFDSNRNDGRFELYTMKLDGSDITRVTNASGDKQNPAWAPSGGRIAWGNGSGLGITPIAAGPLVTVSSQSESNPHWQVDNDPPVTTITGGPAAGSTATIRTAEITFGADEPEASFECRLNAEGPDGWTACASPHGLGDLADGEHTFEVRATDLGGNVEAAPASRTWNVDATPPVVAIESGPAGAVASSDATVEFTVDDDEAMVECRFDSSEEDGWEACESPWTGSGLGEGEHSLELRATDEAGNVSEVASRSWTVDTVAPEVTIESAPPVTSNSIRAEFEFSADEGGAVFECRLDSTESDDWAGCESPLAYGALSDGQHSFEVRATDEAGNTGPAVTHAWEIETIKPVAEITSGPNGLVSSDEATFEFESDLEAATFECRLDSEDPDGWEACESPKVYTELADGAHSFEVRATDPDQGTGPATIAGWTVDTTPPVVTVDQSPSAVTNSADATVAFAIDDPDATVECRFDSTDDEDWTECESPWEQAGLAEGEHAVEIRATDEAGNTGSAEVTWTVDQTAPETTIDVAPPALNHSIRADFEFSADETEVTFECRLDSDDPDEWTECESPQSLGNLDDGEHSFEVRATDRAGNTGEPASHPWQVETVKPIATISSGPANPTADDDATIEFDSDLPAATFECRFDSDDPDSWEACESPVGLTGLADGEHGFEVRATDLDQGTGPAASITWTVDTIAPTVELTGTPAAISGTADPEFTFIASEDGTDAECRLDPVDADDPWLACTSPAVYTGLAEGNHRFEVQVTDAVGHISEPAAFEWIVETTPPQVVITSEPPESPTTFIDAEFSFESANPNAYFQCRLDGGDWDDCESPVTYGQLNDADHTFEVRAVGHGAGAGPVESINWTVDTIVPTVTIATSPKPVTGSRDAAFEFHVNKPGAFDFECSLDGGPAVPCVSPAEYVGLDVGEHSFRVEAFDENGKPLDPATHEWTVVSDAPQVSITEAPPAVAGSATASFRFESNQPAAGFECELDGGGWLPCASPAAFTDLADGSHTVRVRATLGSGPDAAGMAVEHSWKVDTTAPVVRISGGPNGTVSVDSASFAVSVDDPTATTECRLDEGPWEPCDGKVDLAGLTDGEHRFRVRSVDAAGNTGNDRRHWTVDLAAPVTTLTETPNATTTERSARFDFTASKPGSIFECRLDEGTWLPCSPVHTVDQLPLGTHSFEVRATGGNGMTGDAATHTWDVVKPPAKGLVPKVKLRATAKMWRNGNAALGAIACREGICRVTAPKRVAFRLRGRKISPGIKVIRNAFRGKADITLISSRRVRKLVSRFGPARVKVRVKVTSDNGKSRTVTRRVKLIAR